MTEAIATVDVIGAGQMDTCLAIMRVLYQYRPCPLLITSVEAGWLGRKSGRGFHDHRAQPPVPNDRGIRSRGHRGPPFHPHTDAAGCPSKDNEGEPR